MKPIMHYTLLYMILHPEDFRKVTRFFRTIIEVMAVQIYLYFGVGMDIETIITSTIAIVFLTAVAPKGKKDSG